MKAFTTEKTLIKMSKTGKLTECTHEQDEQRMGRMATHQIKMKQTYQDLTFSCSICPSNYNRSSTTNDKTSSITPAKTQAQSQAQAQAQPALSSTSKTAPHTAANVYHTHNASTVPKSSARRVDIP